MTVWVFWSLGRTSPLCACDRRYHWFTRGPLWLHIKTICSILFRGTICYTKWNVRPFFYSNYLAVSYADLEYDTLTNDWTLYPPTGSRLRFKAYVSWPLRNKQTKKYWSRYCVRLSWHKIDEPGILRPLGMPFQPWFPICRSGRERLNSIWLTQDFHTQLLGKPILFSVFVHHECCFWLYNRLKY